MISGPAFAADPFLVFDHLQASPAFDPIKALRVQ